MLNPRQIEAFRTVVAVGGITAAAKALNITQPAVSRLIHDLQQVLHLKLFVKQGTRLVPTNEALTLFREVERQFVGLDRIEAAARNLRDGYAGTLRVAALPAFSVGLLPRVVGRFITDRPDLEIALYGSVSLQIVDWVASGFCDLGFAQLPLDFPNVDIEMLPPAVSVAVVPTGHPLSKKKVLEPTDFAGQPFISIERSSPSRYRLDALFSAYGVTQPRRIETSVSMIACGLVAAGSGVSVVDWFTAEEYRGKGVEIRPLRPSVNFDTAVVWGKGRFRSAAAIDLAERVRAEISNYEVEASTM